MPGMVLRCAGVLLEHRIGLSGVSGTPFALTVRSIGQDQILNWSKDPKSLSQFLVSLKNVEAANDEVSLE
jgi:hypothetical protein